MDIQALIENTQQRSNKQVKLMTRAIDTLPIFADNEIITDVRVSEFGDIWVSIPLDWKLFRQVRGLFDGRYCHQFTNGGALHRSYKNVNGIKQEVVISMRQSLEGSTCRLEKVGEEVSPIYKVVCES